MTHAGFPQFTRLPKELQDLIWKLAVRDTPSRLVELRSDYHRTLSENQARADAGETGLDRPFSDIDDADDDGSHSLGSDMFAPSLTSKCPVPSLLHASHTSRYWALRRWTLSLPSAHFNNRRSEPRIYFDFRTDILYLSKLHPRSNENLGAYIGAADKAKIRHLAWDTDCFCESSLDGPAALQSQQPSATMMAELGWYHCRQYPALESLELVCNDTADACASGEEKGKMTGERMPVSAPARYAKLVGMMMDLATTEAHFPASVTFSEVVKHVVVPARRGILGWLWYLGQQLCW